MRISQFQGRMIGNLDRKRGNEAKVLFYSATSSRSALCGWASTRLVKVGLPDWTHLVRHLVEGRDGQRCVGPQVVQGVDTQPNHGV